MTNVKKESTNNQAPYPTIKFSDFETRQEAAADLIREFGVLVVEDVLSGDECNANMEGIVSCFEKLNPGVLHRNRSETWTRNNLPPYVRYGLQVSNKAYKPSHFATLMLPF